MSNIMEQARLLGQAIGESEAYQTMRAAEEAVTADDKASGLMAKYVQLKNEVQDMLAQKEPDHTLLAHQSEQVEAVQQELNSLELIQDMLLARKDFSDMMGQVNQVIQFMISGDMGQEEGCGGGCGSGGCSGCQGCGH